MFDAHSLRGPNGWEQRHYNGEDYGDDSDHHTDCISLLMVVVLFLLVMMLLGAKAAILLELKAVAIYSGEDHGDDSDHHTDHINGCTGLTGHDIAGSKCFGNNDSSQANYSAKIMGMVMANMQIILVCCR